MGSDAGNDLNLSNFHRKTSPHSGGGNEQLSSDGFHQTLRIDTKPDGYNSGRTYYLQIGSDAEFSRLAISLLYYVKDAIKRFEAKTGLERSQAKVRSLFRSPPFQFTASFFILAVNFPFLSFYSHQNCLIYDTIFASQNFSANILEAQNNVYLTENPDSALGKNLDYLNIFFTFIFFVELMINAFGHWFTLFVNDRWNILDALVVFFSLVALGPIKLPITALRLMRAFRVVRLFGKLRELKRMLTALSSAVIPMLNSFLMMIVIAAICELFFKIRLVSQQLSFSRQIDLSSHAQCHRLQSLLTRPLSCQTRSQECPSSLTKPRTTSGSSTGPSSPCSASRPARRGSRPSPRTTPTAPSTGRQPSSSPATSSSRTGCSSRSPPVSFTWLFPEALQSELILHRTRAALSFLHAASPAVAAALPHPLPIPLPLIATLRR